MDVERLEATKNEILSELHKDVFLTPKGMIKFVQLLIVICAFAMTTSASGTTRLTISKGVTGKPAYSVYATSETKYPFVKFKYTLSVSELPGGFNDTSTPKNKTETDIMFTDGFGAESKFYVFVGVISFLYVLIAIVCYGWFKKISKMSDLFAQYFTKVDFLGTVLLTFLWFLSVTLWSAGFAALRADTFRSNGRFYTLIAAIVHDPSAQATAAICPTDKIPCVEGDSWSKLYGSIIFGYLCVFLFGVDCWYTFKDTEWHAEPEKLGGILQIRTEPGPGPRSTGLDDVNLEAATTHDTATIQPGAI